MSLCLALHLGLIHSYNTNTKKVGRAQTLLPYVVISSLPTNSYLVSRLRLLTIYDGNARACTDTRCPRFNELFHTLQISDNMSPDKNTV